ncbi:metallophosphoesterase [Sporosarcina gallistercoris]|uniref:Metallophosphoesterase family protein n=1 Tax=Sporosarcina gallistercoris TaxID=2762245 RepID=A0ABR8PFM1_9BACL|nr:metallophosphoesterase [Sporosarcina gallistercoris]MBD7906976.1 metallophosphoesterase family protein [Sporosarcina gallistercoris]
MKIFWIGIRVLFACLSLLLGGMLYSAHRTSLKTHRMKVKPSSTADEALTVFFISDVHRRKIPEKLLDKVRSQKKSVDLVIIGGDVAEKGVPLERVKTNVEKLATLGPVYYVWGNNDREIGEANVREIIASVGGTILDNISVRIPEHPDWIISGADDPSSGKTNLQNAVSFEEDYMYQLIAVHNPSLFDKIKQISKPDLLVGGHTHGGQIRFGPFGMQPRGNFKHDPSCARLISNGFGTTMVPLRFGAPPETHLITIQYEKRSGTSRYA